MANVDLASWRVIGWTPLTVRLRADCSVSTPADLSGCGALAWRVGGDVEVLAPLPIEALDALSVLKKWQIFGRPESIQAGPE